MSSSNPCHDFEWEHELIHHIYAYLQGQRLKNTSSAFCTEIGIIIPPWFERLPQDFLENWWSSAWNAYNSEVTKDLPLAGSVANMLEAGSSVLKGKWKASFAPTASNSLYLYLLEFLLKNKLPETAKVFLEETNVSLNDIPDSSSDSQGLLLEFWGLFSPFFSHIYSGAMPPVTGSHFEEQKQCPVCTRFLRDKPPPPIVKAKDVEIILPCNHKLHEGCLGFLVESGKKVCPTCRNPVPISRRNGATICGLCQENITQKSKKKNIHSQACGHRFHKTCFDKFVCERISTYDGSCPVCIGLHFVCATRGLRFMD